MIRRSLVFVAVLAVFAAYSSMALASTSPNSIQAFWAGEDPLAQAAGARCASTPTGTPFQTDTGPSGSAYVGDYFGTGPIGSLSAQDVLAVPITTPKGLLLVVHGDSWSQTGYVYCDRWAIAHGWATYSVDTRNGQDGVPDVIGIYDYLRAQLGSVPICAEGVGSSAGQLAMLLAAARAGLQCVVTMSGAADLVDPTEAIHQLALTNLGGNLQKLSPLTHAISIHQPLLMVGPAADPIVNEAKQQSMKAAKPGHTWTMLLAAGDGGWWMPNARVDWNAGWNARWNENWVLSWMLGNWRWCHLTPAHASNPGCKAIGAYSS